MFAKKISPFGGMLPKIGNRLLPDFNATVASNLKLQSGEIRPLRAPLLIAQPNKPMPPLAIYLARNGLSQQAWFTWPFDVDIVRAPLSIEVESRYYWTGDGAPKYSTYSQAVAGGGDNYPAQAFDLGIPTPKTKPTVGHSGGVGATSTRFYVYTYFSELGEESAPSPVSDIITGKVDGTWAITAMDEFPLNSGTGSAAFLAGFTTFTNSASARHWLRVGDSVVISSAIVVVTKIVSASSFEVAGNFAAATTWARLNNWNIANMKRRLYRTAGTIASFQLVSDDVSTSYNDTLTDSQILGDELISQGWIPPPVELKGITSHPSGALVGFFNNILCLSVPYQPHAWRTADQLATDYEIVGIAVYGTEIGIGTKGSAYVASGVDPESMSLETIKGNHPCLSKRSVYSIGNGFVFSTIHGLALVSVGSNKADILTEQFFTKDEWQEYKPETIVTSIAYGRIYLAFIREDLSQSMLVLDQDILYVVDIPVSELYTDLTSGELYITDEIGIKIWDSPEAYPLTYDWKSKDYILASPVNIGAAKIDFISAISSDDLAILQAIIDAINASNIAILSTGKARGGINFKAYNVGAVNVSNIKQLPLLPPGNSITFVLRKGTEIIASVNVSDTKAFRLPAGYKADTFSVEVIGQSIIKEVRFGETMDSLKTV
jgi:hypothetical protein